MTINSGRNMSVKKIVLTALFGALAGLVMLIRMPAVFASFYKLDVSDSVVLVGGFALGPVPAVIMEALKVLVNMLFNGTDTAFVGEASAFLIGCAFVAPAALVYQKRRTFKGALLGLGIGLASTLIVSSLLNYFVLIPVYAEVFGLPIDAIIEMTSAMNAKVTDLKSLILFATLPFNLVKCLLSAALCVLLYKRVSFLITPRLQRPSAPEEK